MEPITINCPCGYGINLGPEHKTCPICGLNLEPLHRIHALPYQYYKKGLDCFQQQDYCQAKQYFLTCSALIGSMDPELTEYLGLCSLNTGDYDEASKYLAEAATIAPGNARIQKAITLLHTQARKKRWRKGGTIALSILVPIAILVLSMVAWNGHKKTERLEKTLAEQKVIIKAAQEEPVRVKEEVPVPSQYFIPYYVRPGESLSLISYSFYGNGKDWERIYQANRGRISDPNLLENKGIIIIPVDSLMKKIE